MSKQHGQGLTVRLLKNLIYDLILFKQVYLRNTVSRVIVVGLNICTKNQNLGFWYQSSQANLPNFLFLSKSFNNAASRGESPENRVLTPRMFPFPPNLPAKTKFDDAQIIANRRTKIFILLSVVFNWSDAFWAIWWAFKGIKLRNSGDFAYETCVILFTSAWIHAWIREFLNENLI